MVKDSWKFYLWATFWFALILFHYFWCRKLVIFQMRFIISIYLSMWRPACRNNICLLSFLFKSVGRLCFVKKNMFFFWFSEHRAHTCEHDIKSDLFRADSTTHNSSGISNLVSSKAIPITILPAWWQPGRGRAGQQRLRQGCLITLSAKMCEAWNVN